MIRSSSTSIRTFDGPYRFLSNFWEGHPFWGPLYTPGVPGPDLVEMPGVLIQYPTNEHFFQAHKATTFDDFFKVMSHLSPGGAKRGGRKIRCRPDWNDMKLEVMQRGLLLKFSNSWLLDLLIETGDKHLIEGNNWGDDFWGAVSNPGPFLNPQNRPQAWEFDVIQEGGELVDSNPIAGCNWLGKLLMDIRSHKANQTPLSYPPFPA